MDIKVFKEQCQKLVDRFGQRKVPYQLLNEVWQNVKSLDNVHIINKVTHILDSKPISGENITLDDFLDAPKTNENPSNSGLKPSKAKLPQWNKKSRQWSDYGLENYLKMVGASSAVEAMQKQIKAKNN